MDAELARLLGRAAGESPEILTSAALLSENVTGRSGNLRESARSGSQTTLAQGGWRVHKSAAAACPRAGFGTLRRRSPTGRPGDVSGCIPPRFRRDSAFSSRRIGLPVIEAMACGTPVIASDLPVLREVGGVAAEYCPVGDLENWSRNFVLLLCQTSDSDRLARRQACIRQASRFSWSEYARQMVDIYQRVLAW